MTGVGEFLRGHREQKGIRLEEIASITKIHIHHLELIERESWKDLPPEPFLRGFLTAYAKYVGADTREVLGKFYEGRGVTPVEPTEVPPMNAPKTTTSRTTGASSPAMNPSRLIEQAEPFPFAKAMMAVGVVLLVVVVGTLITIGKKEATPAPETTAALTTEPVTGAATNDPTAPVLTAPITSTEAARPVAGIADTKPAETAPATTTTTTTSSSSATMAATAPVVAPAPSKPEAAPATAANTKPAETKPATTAAATEPKPAQATVPGEFKHVLALATQKKTWYKIVVDGTAPVQGMAKENDTLTFNAKEKIKLTLGNASGAKVLHNGTEVDGTKFAGTIRYFKYPASAKFPQDPPKPRAVTSDGDSSTPSTETPSSSGQKTIGDWLDTPRPETQTQ